MRPLLRLVDARKIILIGHGPGCHALMHLMNCRGNQFYGARLLIIDLKQFTGTAATSVMRSVKGIIQVVGHYNAPATPRDLEKLRRWYYEVSIVYCEQA